MRWGAVKITPSSSGSRAYILAISPFFNHNFAGVLPFFMHLLRLLRALVFIAFILLLPFGTEAKFSPAKYGLPASITTLPNTAFDSLMASHPQLASKNIVFAIEEHRLREDKTGDFYMLLGLCLLLGLIRLADPRYFDFLWQSFKNPSLSSRQLKDKLQSATLPNILMNVFFAVSMAAYVYYLVRILTPQRSGAIAPSLLIIMLIAGMSGIYLAKYAVIRFSGWAFRVEGITEHYLFNVFLINKIISIALLPFIVVLAFSDPGWVQPALLISVLLIILLFINRYVRSWQVFGSFFQFSKFHFFTYLCASELLPLAVLMKLLVRGL
jgi:hypothetical protein